MFLTPSDFTGKYELHTGMYDTAKLQSYIDKFEERYLRELLGVDLYNEFISDIHPTLNVPKSPNFIKIFQPLYEDVTMYSMLESEGMLEMLKGFIYFEYAKDQMMQQTTFGGVQQKSENSKVLNTLQTLIYNRYNEAIRSYRAIQDYILLNTQLPTGQAVDFAFVGNSGSGYLSAQGVPMIQLSGSVLGTQLLNAGTGYTTANNVAVTGGTGSGLTFNIVALAGVIQSVTIASRGTGYLQNQVVTIAGGGANATVRLNSVTQISNGTILIGDVDAFPIGGVWDSVLSVAGANYLTLVDVPTTGGAGNGCQIDIMAVSNTGAITNYMVDQKGVNYAVGNQLTITGGNGLAKITVNSVYNGEIEGISWTDAGYNWKSGDKFQVGNGNCIIMLMYVGKGKFSDFKGKRKSMAYWI
mgnify:FL=1|jgi:hypothetical protein